MNKINKTIYFIHKILGTLLSILFVMWFCSGLVMIYHTFPKVTEREKLEKMDALSASLPSIKEITKQIPVNESIESISIQSYLGQTIFKVSTNMKEYKIPADSTQKLPEVDSERIKKVAMHWNKSKIAKIDTLKELDQWIPFGRFKKELPIYKFYFEDKEQHQLYISSHTREVLQQTSFSERAWAWVGAIPHWVYFTSLRQDQKLWMNSVIILSALGVIMTLAGIYVGIHAFVQQKRKKKKFSSPYKKRWFWLHHISGLFFGLFVLTWIFSGMMSLADTPEWLSKIEHKYPIDNILYNKISPEKYPLDYREVIKQSKEKITLIEWNNFRGIPTYNIQKGKNKISIDASTTLVKPLMITKHCISDAIEAIHGTHNKIKINLITEYDDYYIARKHNLPLPVYKVTVDDADNSCYYINPQTGKYHYYNNHERWGYWMYKGLHSLKFKWLVEHPTIWYIVMWSLMIGGTVVSLSGLILGTKYLNRIRKKTYKK